MSRWTGLAVCAALALLVMDGCESRATGSRVDQARTAYQQGNLDDARELFAQALEQDPRDVTAMVGLIDIHLDRGELDRAATRFDAIEGLELDRRSEQLVTRARVRYFQMMYERSRGEDPANPSDAAAYEESLIALFNLEALPAHNDELAERFAIQARTALGAGDPSQPLAPDAPEIQAADIEQLRAALDGYRRFTERDARLSRVLQPPEAILREAEAIVPALERRLFDRRFDAEFGTSLRAAMIAEERFDPEANAIVIHFTSPEPFPGERPQDEALNALREELAVAVVAEELTDLAFRVRGTERGQDDEPLQLGRTHEEVQQAYAGVEVVEFEVARDGIVRMELRVPYGLLPRTAWRLEQYLAWTAEQTEGTGAPSAGTGLGSASEGP